MIYKEILNEDMELDEDLLFEMANIVKSKSGLDVDIWSEHRGAERNTKHSLPRIKLSKNEMSIVTTISKSPEILSTSKGLGKDKAKREFSKGVKYVGDNYDIFEKHYMDTDDSFDDEALFSALRNRGAYL